MSVPFRNRTLLRSHDLTHVDHVLARLDAQHVAVVHGEHGVVAGLLLWTSADGRRLFVDAGAGYSACGGFVCVPNRQELSPPSRPGTYTVWLTADGQAHAWPVAAGRASDAIRLGEAKVVHHGLPTIWKPPVPGRREIRHPDQPYVAGGSVKIRRFDVQVDSDDTRRALQAVISTRSGLFDRPPLYFANVEALMRGSVPLGAPSANVAGWFATILSPRATQFTLQVQVQSSPGAWSTISSAVADKAYDDLSIEVSWIGVLPARGQVRPIDPDVPGP